MKKDKLIKFERIKKAFFERDWVAKENYVNVHISLAEIIQKILPDLEKEWKISKCVFTESFLQELKYKYAKKEKK